MKYFCTGSLGFIGSNLIRILLERRDTEVVVNLDKETYAGNRANLEDVESDPRYVFVHGDICNASLVLSILHMYKPDVLLHLAAESHVDNSIVSPGEFFQTNLKGTFTLLEAVRAVGIGRYVQVSTDEVYGSLAAPLAADEGFPLNPSSPYSASKAGGDMMALSYFKTYKLPIVVTRASNNYGPHQFTEKLIPLMISNALQDKPLPVYGDGKQVRDWVFVDDHCHGILAAALKGRVGEIYNIGGTESLPNIEVVKKILALTGKPESLIEHVTDRPGHDVRYAINSDKLKKETGWKPEIDFENGLRQTVDWYKQRNK